MGKYFLKRVLLLIPTILLVCIIVFALMRMIPMDAVATLQQKLSANGNYVVEDYVRGLRSRGFSEPVIFFRNILKNCAAPLITLLSMSFGSMLGGAAIVESIFVWNGVGKLAVDSITARDYPMIQGYVVWMTVIFLLINILADVISRVIDPRIRREART